MPTDRSLLAQAHAYADRFGWAIIPVKGKEPARSWARYQRTAPTRRQRGGLFTIKGVTGLAVLPGGVSDRLRVRDFDQCDAYRQWAAANPELAERLPTARTRRGFHVYFRADLPDTVTTFQDGELRAGKCIVVLPPSPHPDGGQYEWVVPPGDAIPEIPDVAGAGLLGPAPTGPAADVEVPPEVQAAICKTTPTGHGQRHNLVFAFVRRLKGIRDLDTSPRALGEYVAAWFRAAEPHIKTKAFAATETAFWDAWENAKVPLTDDTFRAVVERALAEPEPTWFETWYFSEFGKRLLMVCLGLQKHLANADGTFFLSARMAGDAVGIHHEQANQLLKKLVKQGYLVLVKKGTEEDKLASVWKCVAQAA